MTDRLWAPWRSAYINMRRKKRCVFCVGRTTKNDDKRYIVKRLRHAFSMLNLYPYNNGHVMVSPYRHIALLEGLSQDEIRDMMSLLVDTKKILDKTLKAHGYNVGFNLGKVSGAGFDGHIHMHIVPRWLGDTNFMPVIADSKIVSDSLRAVLKLLKGHEC